jgi:hypothetical protein
MCRSGVYSRFAEPGGITFCSPPLSVKAVNVNGAALAFAVG